MLVGLVGFGFNWGGSTQVEGKKNHTRTRPSLVVGFGSTRVGFRGYWVGLSGISGRVDSGFVLGMFDPVGYLLNQ